MSALSDALAAYDATPRIESKYKPAWERLREAALSAGMPLFFPDAVAWSRDKLANEESQTNGS